MSNPFHFPVMPNFPPPKIDHNRPQLYPNQADFISGNPRDLQELAGSIYSYVSSQSSNIVDDLVKTVAKLVKADRQPGGYTPGPHGGWVGATADTFRKTFISDAAMMNGLNQLMCTIAKTVDELASGLSELEYQLETKLAKIATKVPGFNVNWLTTKGSGTSPRFDFTTLAPALSVGRSSKILNICETIAQPMFAEADTRRYTAASQLVASGKILQEAFSYYARYSAGDGSPTTMDPNVLLTSGQHDANNPAIKHLQGEYSQLVGQLTRSSLDENAAKGILTGLGITAADSGKILGDIKNLKDAAGTLGRSSKFASLIGDAFPVLMMIGMAA